MHRGTACYADVLGHWRPQPLRNSQSRGAVHATACDDSLYYFAAAFSNTTLGLLIHECFSPVTTKA